MELAADLGSFWGTLLSRRGEVVAKVVRAGNAVRGSVGRRAAPRAAPGGSWVSMRAAKLASSSQREATYPREHSLRFSTPW